MGIIAKIKFINKISKTIDDVQDYLENNKDKIDDLKQIVESAKVILPQGKDLFDKCLKFLSELKKK